jgi:NADH:ubiquinone oxidoreductase subunit 6 (subunit J)
MLFFAGVYLLGAATMVGGVLVIYAGALMIIGLAFIWAAEE